MGVLTWLARVRQRRRQDLRTSSALETDWREAWCPSKVASCAPHLLAEELLVARVVVVLLPPLRDLLSVQREDERCEQQSGQYIQRRPTRRRPQCTPAPSYRCSAWSR